MNGVFPAPGGWKALFSPDKGVQSWERCTNKWCYFFANGWKGTGRLHQAVAAMLSMEGHSCRGGLGPPRVPPDKADMWTKSELLLVTWHRPWSSNVLSRRQFFGSPRGLRVFMGMLSCSRSEGPHTVRHSAQEVRYSAQCLCSLGAQVPSGSMNM